MAVSDDLITETENVDQRSSAAIVLLAENKEVILDGCEILHADEYSREESAALLAQITSVSFSFFSIDAVMQPHGHAKQLLLLSVDVIQNFSTKTAIVHSAALENSSTRARGSDAISRR